MMLKIRKTLTGPIAAGLAFLGFALTVPAAAADFDGGAGLLKLPGAPAADLAALRIWTCTNQEMEWALGVSADGRWISYASGDTGEPMVRDLLKRRSQPVVKVAPEDVWERMAYGSLISPDGSRIAYAWQERGRPMQLRVIGRDGKRDRLLYENKDVSWLTPACWSADSTQVLTVVPIEKEGQSQNQILLISVRDGSVRVLKTFPLDHPEPGGLSLDPTGRYLAYDIQSTQSMPEHEIRVLSIQSGEETVVLGGAADHRCFGWSPDGGTLLLASNRGSATDCWVQGMENGKPRGEPQRLKINLGTVTPLGITRQGGFYYGVDGTTSEVQIGRLDLALGEFVSEPKSIDGKDRGHESEPCWSPDGKRLAYISWKDGDCRLYVRSIDTREECGHSPAVGPFYTPRWSADGESILLYSAPKDGSTGKFRLDLRTGEAEQLKAGEDFPLACRNRLFTFRRDREKNRLLAKNRDTGEEKVLYQEDEKGSLGTPQMAPNGEHIAFMCSQREGGVRRVMVKVVSASGGEARELIGGTNYLASLAWFPDSQRLLCCGEPTACVLSLDGQPPRKLKARLEGHDLTINRDGQQVAFVKWNFRSELWLMENAVPPLTKVKRPGVRPTSLNRNRW